MSEPAPSAFDEGLLLALLALHLGFVDCEGVVRVLRARRQDPNPGESLPDQTLPSPDRSVCSPGGEVGDLLRQRCALPESRLALLTALVRQYQQMCAGSVPQGFPWIVLAEAIRQVRAAADPDTEVLDALAQVPSSPSENVTLLPPGYPPEGNPSQPAKAGPDNNKDTLAAPVSGRPIGAPVLPGYEIMEEAGRGGMGVVYKAVQVRVNRVVALKMILGAGHPEPSQLARFLAEASAAAQLRHDNIVQLHEAGEHGGLPYFSMEWVSGGGLDRRLAMPGRPGPCLPSRPRAWWSRSLPEFTTPTSTASSTATSSRPTCC